MELVERIKAQQVTLKALPETDIDQKNAKLTAIGQTEATSALHLPAVHIRRDRDRTRRNEAGKCSAVLLLSDRLRLAWRFSGQYLFPAAP